MNRKISTFLLVSGLIGVAVACQPKKNASETQFWGKPSEEQQLRDALRKISEHQERIGKLQTEWNRLDGLIKQCIAVRGPVDPKNPVFNTDANLSNEKCASYMVQRTKINEDIVGLKNEIVSYQDDVANLQLVIRSERHAEAKKRYDESMTRLRQAKTQYTVLAKVDWDGEGCKALTASSEAYLASTNVQRDKCDALAEKIKEAQKVYDAAILESQNALIRLNNVKNEGMAGPQQPELKEASSQPTCREDSYCGPFAEAERDLCKKWSKSPEVCMTDRWNKDFYLSIKNALAKPK